MSRRAFRSRVSRTVLLLLGLGVHVGGGHVGQGAGRGELGDRLAQLRRRLGHQVEDLQGLGAQVDEAGLDLRVRPGRLGQKLAARDEERPAFDEAGHVEPLHALADDVMLAVLCGDVAQDVGDDADVVHLFRRRIGLRRIALQQHDDLALLAHGLLRGGDGRLAGDDDRQHDLGNSTMPRIGTTIKASVGGDAG